MKRCHPIVAVLFWLISSLPGLVYPGDDSSHTPAPSVAGSDLVPSSGRVDIGIQPLWLPSGIIAEVMKRDAVLRRDLQQLGAVPRFYPYFKGSDVSRAMHDGQLVGGIAGDMPVITACVKDQIRVASLADIHYVSVVAREFKLLSELRGQRIGYAFGSNAHYALLTALSANGLTEADVTWIPMEVSLMPQALQRGEIDAYGAWEPTPTVSNVVYGHKVIHRAMSVGYLYFSRPFAERYPDRVLLLVAAEIRALNWLQASEYNFSRAVTWSTIAIRNLQGRDFALSRRQTLTLAKETIRNLWTLPVIPANDVKESGHVGRAATFLRHIGKMASDYPWDEIAKCFHREMGVQILSDPSRYRIHEFDYGVSPR
ncbi:MAG: ABC transporter substrate-binding protein [Magnetococcales bacterium]|nr:ABC transporter substrate-binding protein [Magnetococcales bacterium]